MSKCGICGNELLTGDLHWTIGICNNCYNKLYKSDEQKYVDMLHKETGELLVNSLAEKDKQIAELQKQLEETKQTGSYQVMLMCQKENILLKQQLKSQPKEIIEKIKGQLLAICQIGQYHRSDKMIMNFQAFNNVLDTILKKYGN